MKDYALPLAAFAAPALAGIVISFTVPACMEGDERERERRHAASKASGEACVAAGGIPTVSAWTGLTDGCGAQPSLATDKEQWEINSAPCVAAGGVPFRHQLGVRLLRCEFNPYAKDPK